MALFCIDFDNTIANGHTHNKIMMEVVKDKKLEQDNEAQWNIAKKISPVGKASHWKETLEQLIQDGHEIAIVSFNAFGHIIPRYLKEVIGLNVELANKIAVVSFLPDNPSTADKSAHIAKAIAETKTDAKSLQNIILVDDSLGNIKSAKQSGYRTITADATGVHLKEIKDLSSLMSKKISKSKSKFFKQDNSNYVRLVDMKEDDKNTSCCRCFF